MSHSFNSGSGWHMERTASLLAHDDYLGAIEKASEVGPCPVFLDTGLTRFSPDFEGISTAINF
jgi:hypothetical protein